MAGMKIALVGDSHMQALGPLLRPALERLGADVIRTTAQQGWGIVRYLAAGTLASSTAGATLAIVELGGNDRVSPEDADAYASLLGRVRAQIGAPYVLWIGPGAALDPATSLAHETVSNLQQKLVPKLAGTTWFDSRPYTQEHHRADGVHFDVEGYQKLAERIVDAYVWITTSPVVRACYLGSFTLFSALRHIGQ